MLLRLLLWLYLPFLAVLVGLLAWLTGYLLLVAFSGPRPFIAFVPAIILGLTLGQVLWASRVLLVRLRDDRGIELWLPRRKFAEFHAWVGEVARQRRLRPPHRIRLAAEGSAWVYESEEDEEVLVLGASIVATCSRLALAGVVAHELGHFTAGDTRLRRRAHRRSLLMDLLDHEFSVRQGARLNPIVWIVEGYHLAFRLLRAADSRRGELAEDRQSVQQAGRDVAAAALIRVYVTDRLPYVRLSSVAESCVATNDPLDRLFTEHADRLRRVRHSDWEDACRKELEETTGLFDSHPSLRERLRAMGVSPRKALKLALDQIGPPAHDLIPGWEGIERELTERLIAVYQEIHWSKLEARQIMLGPPGTR
jgi:Zn-dependent protease with chaperone function